MLARRARDATKTRRSILIFPEESATADGSARKAPKSPKVVAAAAAAAAAAATRPAPFYKSLLFDENPDYTTTTIPLNPWGLTPFIIITNIPNFTFTFSLNLIIFEITNTCNTFYYYY